MTATSLDLSQIKTDALSSAATFRTLIGLGSSDAVTFSQLTIVDTPLVRDAANALAQRNGTNAQTFRLYNTYTSDTSYERGFMRWNSNVLQIGTEAGSGGGTEREIILGRSDRSRIRIRPSDDMHLYRYNQERIRLNSSGVSVWGSLVMQDSFFQLSEMTLPSTPSVNQCRIYAKDNGSGNTQLVSLMPDGVETVLSEQNRSQLNYPLTWNDGATTFTGLKLDVTDTASASASLLMDLQVGGSSLYRVTKSGGIEGVELKTIGASSTSRIWQAGGLGVLSNQTANIAQWLLDEFNSYGRLGIRVNTARTYIDADAANTLAQRNGTNAQTFRLYNTYTSSTSFENLQLQWNTNEARIGTSVGSSGGTQRVMNFGVWNSSGTWKSMLSFNDTTQLLTIPSPYTLSVVLLQLSGLYAQIRGHLGNITLTNHTTANDFGLLRFGGILNTYPAIKRNGTALNFRLADDSADCGITASTGVFSGQLTNAIGTITASTPATFTQTWNEGATEFTGISLNVTNTASATRSWLMDLKVGGSSKFKIRRDGAIFLDAIPTEIVASNSGVMSFNGWNQGITLTQAGALSWSIFNSPIYTSSDLFIRRDAANTLAQRNGTNAQTFRLYNTYTSGTSYERGKLEWSSNVFRIGTEKGSAGGSARAMELQTDGITKLTVTTGGTLTVPETVTTPTGTTTTVDLEAGNHQTLDLGSASGDVTVTLTVPSASSAGTIILLQGTTVRDATWTPSSGSIIWMGGEPDWNSDPSNTSRIVAWRWNGTDLRLAPSEASV